MKAVRFHAAKDIRVEDVPEIQRRFAIFGAKWNGNRGKFLWN